MKKQIPCTCPKGGMDDNNNPCQKCEGSQWIDLPAKEYLSKIGSIKSKRKANSSRRNGKLGGRPKKKASPPLVKGKQ